MTLRQRLQSAVKAFRHSGIGGQNRASFGVPRRQNLLYWFLPGTRQDYTSKAGDLWRNSLVGICLNWWTLSFPEAPLTVKSLKSDGAEEFFPDHPLAALIRRPNPDMGGRRFWAGTLISFLCDGNAYWVKERGGAGQPVALRYVPHFQMEPRWPEDGSAFISHYERYVDGEWVTVPKEDVVHFTFGIDPDNTRKGLAPLKQQLRQIFSDNEYSTFVAALMENAGICPLVIGPDSNEASAWAETEEEAERVKKKFMAHTTGDKRGEPFLATGPFKLEKLAYSPDEMSVQVLNNQWTSRTCAALLLDPMVVGLPSETNTHYDNREQAERGAWNNGILPVMALLAETLDLFLLTDFPTRAGQFCAFDTRHVRALQVDEDALYKRLVSAAGGPVLTPNEARAKLDLPPVPDGDTLREKQAPPEIAAGAGQEARQQKAQIADRWRRSLHGVH